MSRSPERRDAGATSGDAGAASEPESEELARLRDRIDRVDRGILELLNERARHVQAVGHLKARAGLPVYSAARERALRESLVAANPGPFPSEAIGPVFREIVSATRSLERRLRVAYLGPAGTFAHEAASRHFGHSVDLLARPSIPAVFSAVARGEADMGVVPVENTTQGVVTATLDTIAEVDVVICGETLLRISQQLLSRSGRLEDVRRVASHPQGLAQCRRWLEEKLPGVVQVETASTAAAAELAAGDAAVAAIGSAAAGETYALSCVAASIEDRADNTTRFLLIGREMPPPSGRDLTTAVFTVRKAQPGALHRLLEPFSRCGVNLTSIQSRPMPGRPWEYLFYLDLEGHTSDPPVAKALAEVAEIAHSQRVLGSFPRAAAEEGS